MIILIAAVLFSWLLLLWTYGQNLYALGISITARRIRLFIGGMIVSAIFVALYYFLSSLITHNPYRINPLLDLSDIIKATWSVLLSVLFEELLFRGAILYILINKLNKWPAIIISAALFGIYHWFTRGILGQPVAMIQYFLTMGAVGFVLALAFANSKTIWLPIGLHLGFNFVSMIIFSTNTALGNQLLSKTFATDPSHPGIFISAVMKLLYMFGFPLLAYLYVRDIRE